jgi:hypothetical protein
MKFLIIPQNTFFYLERVGIDTIEIIKIIKFFLKACAE